MKKRIGLFLLAAILTVLAIASTSQPALAICTGPLCYASPGCCFNWQCDSWCGGAGLGRCGGTPQNGGGCCYCNGGPAES